MNKNTIIIGDIHGLGYWREIVKQHSDCRVVFMGDYLDPYYPISRTELLANLEAIIELKRQRGDEVILLLGNHDLHYFTSDMEPCMRFDFDIAEQASTLFRNNFELFRYAHQQGNALFTHAGISDFWFKNDFKGDPSRDIADQLNHPTAEQVASLCRIGESDGGEAGAVGGIFWTSREELANPLHGYKQFVGHHYCQEVTTQIGLHQNDVIFCDCLRAGNYLLIED